MATTSDYDYLLELVLDTSSGLYNLFITTFNGDVNVLNFDTFLCTRRHAGRLDLVSADLYNDTKWTGSLCTLNDILNPFSIRDGDVILYLPESDLQGLLNVPDNVMQVASAIKNDLINILKAKVPDGSRANYLNNNSNNLLPPTILPQTAPQIVMSNNKIQIAPNLFNNPNNTPAPTPPTTTTSVPNAPTSPSNNDVQLVLVKKYIKLANG